MKSTEVDSQLVKLLHCCGDLREEDVLILAADQHLHVTEAFNIAYPSFNGCLDVLQLQQVSADLSVLHQKRWAVACVFEPHLENQELTRLLARLRDLHAERVFHIDAKDSLALGFSKTRCQIVESDKNYRVFEFNLSTYKRSPDWLNARHWANPELWDKHRW